MKGIYARIPDFLKIEMDNLREKSGIRQEKQIEMGIKLFLNEWKNKNLIKDEKAIMNPIITFILSMAVIIIMYRMFMPFLWFLANTMISMGAPAASTLFFMTMAQWGFYVFALAACVILLAKVWKKTHDTGIHNVYGR